MDVSAPETAHAFKVGHHYSATAPSGSDMGRGCKKSLGQECLDISHVCGCIDRLHIVQISLDNSIMWEVEKAFRLCSKAFYSIHQCLHFLQLNHRCSTVPVSRQEGRLTLYSMFPSSSSLFNKMSVMSGLDVAIAQAAGPAHTRQRPKWNTPVSRTSLSESHTSAMLFEETRMHKVRQN